MAGVPGMKTGGHNKKPPAVHALQGTFRRDRHVRPQTAPAVAQQPGCVPPCPSGLSAASRRLWGAFHTQYDLLSVPACELLESALRSRDLAEQARQILKRDGLTFPGSDGKPRAHPATAVHRDTRAAYVSTLRVLGFPEPD
jgi:hypothetical protein